ncbi:MAG: aspartate kinase [Planctomycetota bacterium]
MIVQKFGGTSVGGAGPIRRLGDIVATNLHREPLVVVSAVAGVTNRLFRCAELARTRGDWRREHAGLVELHAGLCSELEVDFDPARALLGDLEGLLRGIELLGECTPRSLDYVASFGERISARIVAAHLTQAGIPASALDAWDAGLVTDSRFGSARPLATTPDSIRAALRDRKGVSVITGYVARDAHGVVTTLGRGGSDYSAAIFGAALGAEEIQIWTDVDGVMSADPRIVPSARHLGSLSYAEAAELAFFGAKVLHPATIVPAVERGIPIRVLNSYRPDFEGTCVTTKAECTPQGLKSIATKDGIAVVNIVASAMMLQFGFLERIADVFARHRIVVDVIATSEVSVALSTDESAPGLDDAVRELSLFAQVNVVRDLALVSLVGAELRARCDLLARALGVLAERNVQPEMLSYGATRNNLSIVLARSKMRATVEALHSALLT